jgi:peptidoglycan/xylan/chitin deacetylase (PgdA/CDA1 family)
MPLRADADEPAPSDHAPPRDAAAHDGEHRAMSSRRLAEWLACVAVHYSGLDRLIAPLHRQAGSIASIVMYHRVHPDGRGPDWWLTQSAFRAQLRHLTRHYRVMPMAEMAEMLIAGAPLPPRAVAVTFDDGYRDNYTQAFPVIRETGCPTTIFLTAGLIETRETLWWDKLLYVVGRTTMSRGEVDEVFQRHAVPPPDWRGPDVEQAVLALKRRREGEMQREVDIIAAELGVDPTANSDDFMMTWDEAREMVESGLVTMGAHTMSHRNL